MYFKLGHDCFLPVLSNLLFINHSAIRYYVIKATDTVIKETTSNETCSIRGGFFQAVSGGVSNLSARDGKTKSPF